MIGLVSRFRLRILALFAVVLLTAWVTSSWPEASATTSQRVLSVTASPRIVEARGGESRITVRISAEAAGDQTRVSLSTELGAFGSASGPPAIDDRLDDVGNDLLGASVILVGDGRAGTTVVRAQVGSLVDTVTIRFVGTTTTIRLDQPDNRARLDASEQHLIRLAATDITGLGAPSAQISLQIVEAPKGATLRSGSTSTTTSFSITTNQSGRATVYLSSDPGDVTIRASSGEASLTMQFQLYGAPDRLRLVPISEPAMEFGSIGDAGSIQVLLQDERGQGVPNERIVFSAESGLVVRWDGDGESQVTDDSGTARVHLDSRSARLGVSTVSATWFGGGSTLGHSLPVRVTGTPTTLYLWAEVTRAEVDEVLIEEFASSTRYRLYAEVVDRLGQRVAGTYQVRWWPVVSRAGAQVYPQVSETRDGVATAIFDLQHVDGRPYPESTSVQAWLIAKAQVNNNGLIGNLLGPGEPLRARWNDLTWLGPEIPVSEAVAAISSVVSAAWLRTEAGGWQAWFTADVPGAVDFTLSPGDRFYLVLRSAALLENVQRR
ncbi:MAG: hypothetical protein OXT70_14330 [Chloroflexota bacterium]|nr:hypothetical protein [Chloroflexota bacterium]